MQIIIEDIGSGCGGLRMNVVYVALGSALGGVCRYGLSLVLNSPTGFPWGTLGVNVLGSFAIGFLSGWLAQGVGNAAAIRAFAVVGFCGGVTTFSTFSNEAFRMMEQAQWGMLVGYIATSLLAGLAAVWLGLLISRLG